MTDVAATRARSRRRERTPSPARNDSAIRSTRSASGAGSGPRTRRSRRSRTAPPKSRIASPGDGDGEDRGRHQGHVLQLAVEPDHDCRAADEEEHGDAVEEPLDGDGGQRRRLAHAVALLQHPRPHQLADPQREDVVGGVADDHDREDVAGRDVVHRAQQHVPAVGADDDPGIEEDERQRQPAPVDPGERVADLRRILPAEGEEEEDEADRQADPDARRAKGRLARGGLWLCQERLHRRDGSGSRAYRAGGSPARRSRSIALAVAAGYRLSAIGY